MQEQDSTQYRQFSTSRAADDYILLVVVCRLDGTDRQTDRQAGRTLLVRVSGLGAWAFGLSATQ